jgi:hypothetical protein
MRTLMPILAMLATLALTTAPAAAKLDCLTTQAQARKVYPAQALKYRQINDTRCWYAGRTRAKSEFRLLATASSRADLIAGVAPGPRETNHAGEAPGPSTLAATSGKSAHNYPESRASTSASRRGEPAPDDPHRTAYSVTFEHDAILAACGMRCPQLMAFEERWHIATGERR